MRRCLRQQLCSGIAKAALIEEEEVEAGEVRCDQGELLAQRSLRQAQRSRDGEPVSLDVEEHERTVVAPAGGVEAGNAHFGGASSSSSRAELGAAFKRIKKERANSMDYPTTLDPTPSATAKAFSSWGPLPAVLSAERDGRRHQPMRVVRKPTTGLLRCCCAGAASDHAAAAPGPAASSRRLIRSPRWCARGTLARLRGRATLRSSG